MRRRFSLAPVSLSRELSLKFRGVRSFQNISVAILAQRKAEDRIDDDDEKKRNGDDAAAGYARLRDAAAGAYRSLVAYGSSVDLSNVDGKRDGGAGVAFLGEARRSRLSDVGRKLWMTIRNNPGLFNDAIPDEVVGGAAAGGGGAAGDPAPSSFGGRKDRAVAGGYSRAIAARLVFLDHIDTRCGVGRPPRLRRDDTSAAVGQVVVRDSSPGRSSSSSSYPPPPSLQELVFGLKLFSRSGRAILEHDRADMGGARASYDLLALAASCFEAVAVMADGGSGEAAEGMREILDEAFDAISTMPNAASLLGGLRVDDGTGARESSYASGLPESNIGRVQEQEIVEPWETLVLKGLGRVESFVNGHCDVSNSGKSQPASKFATLQRFLPSLARLCYRVRKHSFTRRYFRHCRVLIRNERIARLQQRLLLLSASFSTVATSLSSGNMIMQERRYTSLSKQLTPVSARSGRN